MKLLIDMNLSPLWVAFFAEHSIEATHWSTVGPVEASDREIFAYAATHKYTIFTHDLDFGTLLASTGSKNPSVIQIRGQDVLPSAIGQAVLGAIDSSRDHLESGALVTIDLMRHRMRILPIH